MSKWRVEPFKNGPQPFVSFGCYIEAFTFAIRRCKATQYAWAIFGPDHELDAVVRPEDRLPGAARPARLRENA